MLLLIKGIRDAAGCQPRITLARVIAVDKIIRKTGHQPVILLRLARWID
jgi:hypothetical protein